MKLPQEFIEMAKASIGAEALAVYLDHFNNTLNISAQSQGAETKSDSKSSNITSIRVNPAKMESIQTLDYLLKDAEPVPWCGTGYYLPHRPQFTLDPLFHCGAYYVQEASSMYIQKAFEAIEANEPGFLNGNIKILDLCAAPGGKSTHIASLINRRSLLVSNEVIKSRAVILADNMAKWGAENVVVTNNDPRDFKKLNGYFNLIVVDAPCSGEGMFIKDPAAINEWSPANVDLCASRQRRILQDIWNSLQEGGYLIYSTCTFNHLENDNNLQYIVDELGADVIEINFITTSENNAANNNTSANNTTDHKSNIIKTPAGGYQFVPGLVKGEGQYMAVVKKLSKSGCEGNDRVSATEADYSAKAVKGKRGDYRKDDGKKGGKNGNNQLKGFTYLLESSYELALAGELVKAYPKELANDIKYLESQLRIVSSGIAAAILKGKDYIPHADLALISSYAHNANKPDGPDCTALPFPVVELSKEQALAYLSKEPLVLANEPNGYLLLTYSGLPLGFVKNLGNRSNNLWPQARRIRMSH